MADTSLIQQIRTASRLMVRELGFMNTTLAATHYSPSAVHTPVSYTHLNRLRGSGFPRAGFPNEGQHFAALNGKADVMHHFAPFAPRAVAAVSYTHLCSCVLSITTSRINRIFRG